MPRPMTPPQKLRVELGRLRDRGYTFRQAWSPAVSSALRDEPIHAAVMWRHIFNETRPVWLANYDHPRIVWPTARAPVLDTPDLDASVPASPRARTPVAA